MVRRLERRDLMVPLLLLLLACSASRSPSSGGPVNGNHGTIRAAISPPPRWARQPLRSAAKEAGALPGHVGVVATFDVAPAYGVFYWFAKGRMGGPGWLGLALVGKEDGLIERVAYSLTDLRDRIHLVGFRVPPTAAASTALHYWVISMVPQCLSHGCTLDINLAGRGDTQVWDVPLSDAIAVSLPGVSPGKEPGSVTFKGAPMSSLSIAIGRGSIVALSLGA
jgi:hypothetical protein